MKSVTQKEVRAVLQYAPATGIFTWKASPTRPYNGHVGRRAGRTIHREYRAIKIDGKSYLEHRLAWLWMKGEWPHAEIDHKNGVRSDNRWDNLREATRAINMQNRKRADKDSLSGILGVTPHGNRWKAQIVINGRTKNLGAFDTTDAAKAAYISAKRKYHPGSLL